MKFCKKCHKKIITKVHTERDRVTVCYCNRTLDVEATSELGGVFLKQLTKKNRLEFRRC